MATVNIKRYAANVLANYIASNVSGLAGKVSAVAAGPETNAPCLAVKILPETLTFEESEPDEVYFATPDDGKVVVDIGTFSGLFTIQLFTASAAERELYEQKILDLFLSGEWSSGTLYLTMPSVTVNGYASLYDAEFTVFLQSTNWNDELAFEAKRFSFIEVDVEFPALTTYNAITITSLQLSFSDDINKIILTTADADPGVEVQEDGTTIPATV